MDLNKIVQELAEKGVVKEDMKFDGSNEGNSLQTLLYNILGFLHNLNVILLQKELQKVGREQKGKGNIREPGKEEKTLKRAIKLYNERETNGMSVNAIVKATGVPRSSFMLKGNGVAVAALSLCN